VGRSQRTDMTLGASASDHRDDLTEPSPPPVLGALALIAFGAHLVEPKVALDEVAAPVVATRADTVGLDAVEDAGHDAVVAHPVLVGCGAVVGLPLRDHLEVIVSHVLQV